MRVMVGKAIVEHFKHDEPDKAKYYVGEDNAKYFSKFEVVCVIDMEDTAMMHQVIVLEMNDEGGRWPEIIEPAELEELFMDDNMYGIKAVGVDYETQRFVVSLTHSY